MRLRLRESFSDRRIAVVVSLGLMTLFTVAMLAGRMAYTGSRGHGWLIWNLFLAWIPFLLALLLYERARARAPLRVLVPLGLVWLVFFPNAPYLVTDLKHVGGGGLGAELAKGLLHPLDHPRPLALTVLLTSFLLTSYLVLYSFARLNALARD
jgi:uncharacterized membrane protein